MPGVLLAFCQLLSRCSKSVAIKLCALSEMHAKVRKESVAGYANDETLACGPQDHTRWRQIYSGHMQGLLYRLVLNSCLPPPNGIFAVAFRMCGPPNFRYVPITVCPAAAGWRCLLLLPVNVEIVAVNVGKIMKSRSLKSG